VLQMSNYNVKLQSQVITIKLQMLSYNVKLKCQVINFQL